MPSGSRYLSIGTQLTGGERNKRGEAHDELTSRRRRICEAEGVGGGSWTWGSTATKGKDTDKGAGGGDPGQEWHAEREGEGTPVAAGGRRGRRAPIRVGLGEGGLVAWWCRPQERLASPRSEGGLSCGLGRMGRKKKSSPTRISPSIQFFY